MKSSSLLSELLVIGVWSLFWCFPILKEIIRPEYFIYFTSPNLNSIIFLLAILYFLGMFINYVGDITFNIFDKRIAKKYGGKGKLHNMREKILLSNSYASSYMLQHRSFIRIFRANSINIFLILVVYVFNFGNIRSFIKISNLAIILFMISLLIICIMAYFKSLKGYFSFLMETGTGENFE